MNKREARMIALEIVANLAIAEAMSPTDFSAERLEDAGSIDRNMREWKTLQDALFDISDQLRAQRARYKKD